MANNAAEAAKIALQFKTQTLADKIIDIFLNL